MWEGGREGEREGRAVRIGVMKRGRSCRGNKY